MGHASGSLQVLVSLFQVVGVPKTWGGGGAKRKILVTFSRKKWRELPLSAREGRSFSSKNEMANK